MSLIKANIIFSKGKVAVIELPNGDRYVAPESDLVDKDGEILIEEEKLDLFMEYGFSLRSDIVVKAEDILKTLRSNGIWTHEDLDAKPEIARQCMVSVFNVTYSRLLDLLE